MVFDSVVEHHTAQKLHSAVIALILLTSLVVSHMYCIYLIYMRLK